jgi:hypothetical protein
MTERQPRPASHAVRRAIPVAAMLSVLAGCEVLGTRGKPAAKPDPVPTGAVERGQEVGANAPSVPALPQRPTKHHLRVSQFVFYSNFPINESDPLFRELEDLPDQLRRELRLPLTSSLVQVFLFDDQDSYESFLRAWHPKLPLRPAYFIADKRGPGGATELLVYTYVGRRLRTDLRHELTHALLHGVLKGVPLWLDEGLAGFFEQPTANDGLNPSHLESLRVGPFQPNLTRLEKLTEVADMQRRGRGSTSCCGARPRTGRCCWRTCKPSAPAGRRAISRRSWKPFTKTRAGRCWSTSPLPGPNRRA